MLGLLCATLASACPGSLSDPQRFVYLDGGSWPSADGGTVGGCDAVSTVFAPSCSTSGCHSGGTQQAGLDLESPGMPARFINKKASGGPGLLVDKANPAQSVLYLKVTDNPPFNFQMPLGAPPLSEQDQQCIKQWVLAAAAQAKAQVGELEP